ncbi:MAG: hydroxymethylbilane synthase [Acidimicrobiales bacterium]
MKLRIATRGSRLARWQAEHVAGLLRAAHGALDVELVIVETTGDQRRDIPLHAIGGQGVFVKEVQQAVLEGRAELAVHSAKDLPSTTAPGLSLAAVPARGDVRDGLVGARLDDLAPGATVATGSVRRRAQLLAARPDLHVVELRGNVDTRLTKIPDGGAIVMAVAPLERLGWADRLAEALDPERFVPQVAQGALAVECRADDGATAAMVAAIQDTEARRRVDAERAFLAAFGGGCDLPIGAWHDGERLHGFAALGGGVHQVVEPVAGAVQAGALGQALRARLGV